MNFLYQFWYAQTWEFLIIFIVMGIGWAAALILTILQIKKPKKIAKQIEELKALTETCKREQTIALQQIEHLDELTQRYTAVRADLAATTDELHAAQGRLKATAFTESLKHFCPYAQSSSEVNDDKDDKEDKEVKDEPKTEQAEQTEQSEKGEQPNAKGSEGKKAGEQLGTNKKAVKGQKNGSK